MNILITGGAGFLGSNLVKKMIDNSNSNIYIIDNLRTGSIKNIKNFLDNKRVKFFKKDIRDNKIIEFIKKLDVDLIYNFACIASPDYYFKYPIETWETSVLGVRNLLEVIKGTKIKLYHSSTSEIYGDPTVNPQQESYYGNVNPIGLRSCYDEGKRAAESLIYDYIRVYDVDVRVTRIFNTYGPNMNKEDGRVISNFINKAIKNEDMVIYGNGKQTRSFCFVDDTLDAIIKLMNLEDKIDYPINVGNPYEITIYEVANIVKKLLNSKSNIIFYEARNDDPKKRKPDINKAKKILKWEPKVLLEDGLKKSIEYYKNV